MTTQQFNTISSHHQLRSLLVQGACIGNRKTDELQVVLFQLQRFYVEVFLTPDCDEVIGSRNFDNLDELQPYLNT